MPVLAINQLYSFVNEVSAMFSLGWAQSDTKTSE